MNIQVRIDSREVTNPVARRLIAAGVFIIAILILTVCVVVVLPLLGLALGVAAGAAVVGVLATAVSVPVLLLFNGPKGPGRRRELPEQSPRNLRN